MTMTMTDDRLLDLIDAYGAEPMAWPEDERAAAEAHLAAHPARFAEAIDTARMLDLAFSADEVPEAPGGLAARILNEAPAATPERQGIGARLRSLVFPNGLRWPASATAAALVMGFSAGVFSAPATADDTYTHAGEDVVYAALGYGGFETYIDEVGE